MISKILQISVILSLIIFFSNWSVTSGLFKFFFILFLVIWGWAQIVGGRMYDWDKNVEGVTFIQVLAEIILVIMAITILF